MATLTRMYQRRGTAAQWANVASTVILQSGEVGYESDTGKFKIGNGSDVWSALSYYLKDTQNAAIYAKLAPGAPGYNQTITGINVFQPQATNQTPVVVSGIVGQSAVLQRWRDSSDATLASMDATGKLTATGALFNANVDMNSNKITNVATPTSNLDAANKQYVDDVAAGIAWKAPVNLVSASGLNTYINVPLTGNTSTLVLDGHAALDSGDNGYRILLIQQTTSSQNGIYVYNDNGTTYTLTRSTDADTYQEINGASVFVSEGTNYGTSSWVQTNHYLTSFSGQQWVQFNGASQIVAGDGLDKSGNTLFINAGTGITVETNGIKISDTYTGQASITNLGIIGTGTWSASTIAANKGGTGQTSYAVGDILYADTTSTLAKRSSTTSGYPLLAGGPNVAPNYGQLTTTGIANSSSTTTGVTYAKLQYVSAQYRVLGRKTAGSGIVEELTSNDAITMINQGDGNTKISFNILPSTTSGGNNGSASTVARSDHTHTINDLSDVVISGTPVTRQVIKFNGTNWVNEVPSGGIVVSATPPSQPASGDGWFDSTDGSLYIYYDDGVDNDGAGPGTSAQWVQVKANSALEASLLTRVSALEAQQTNAAYNIIAPKTASYTVGNGDQNDLIQMNSGSALNLLIPTDATYNFPIGTKIEILQIGTGQVTIAAVTPGTTTVNGTPGLKLRAQWSHAAIIKRAANTWVAIGDLAA